LKLPFLSRRLENREKKNTKDLNFYRIFFLILFETMLIISDLGWMVAEITAAASTQKRSILNVVSGFPRVNERTLNVWLMFFRNP
jgi:hypothetical protein